MSSTPPRPLDPDIFGRVLADGGTAAERAAVDAFVCDHPEFNVLTTVARRGDPPTGIPAPAGARERLAAYLGVRPVDLPFWSYAAAPSDGTATMSCAPGGPVRDAVTPRGLRAHVYGRRYVTAPRRWRAATFAGAMLAAVMGAVAMRGHLDFSGSDYERPGMRYATLTGRRAVVTLVDGTRVTLAPQTVLTVVADFGARRRAVTLDGEAYFEVSHSGGTPFVVRSGVADATVLGTEFLVRHYRGDRRVRVIVTSGKVALAARTARGVPLTLVGGRVGEVSDSGVTTTPAGDPARYSAWRDDRLVFRDAPTAEVLDALSRWYGYRFRLADSSLYDQALTAVLSTRSSREALTTLKLVLDVDATFDGDIITLTRRSAGRAPRPADRRGEFTPHRGEVGR